ncbi:hypothetical protein AMS68_003733 [Peltaster fructicola]|uniref:Uncharacterized protein n=1 Tax=Peltaster fructicola TaxID=286661 RepID=A0A6H0XU59_9PEZI|nr:hypothetical protein AMS68_003733 [Peltaster fructicola]
MQGQGKATFFCRGDQQDEATCDALIVTSIKAFFDASGHPVLVDSQELPSVLRTYGQWYWRTDRTNARSRIEVPFSKVLGRYHESSALIAWYGTPERADTQVRRTAGHQ